MDEQTIRENLKQNIPQSQEITPTASVSTTPDSHPGQATTSALIDLDEITQYKLHDLFGEPYRANDEVKRQQLQYIYGKVSSMAQTTEYGFVVAKIRSLEQLIGITQDERKMQKMYQWLKLDSIRKNVDLQMESI